MAHLWASLWESYLVITAPASLDRRHCLGRVKAPVQFTKGESRREGRAILTDEERQLWRMFGLAQLLWYREAIYPDRTWRRLRLLHSSLSAKRSIDLVDTNDPGQLLPVIGQLRAAINQACSMAITNRRIQWNNAISANGGVNPLTRKLIKGPATPVLIIRSSGEDLTCPQKQADVLCDAWNAIGKDEPPPPLHPTLRARCTSRALVLPMHTAESVQRQIKALKNNTSHSLDWWRPAELKRLPAPAYSMLANIFNTAEESRTHASCVSKGTHSGGVQGKSSGPATSIWSSARYQDMSGWVNEVTEPSQSAFNKHRSARAEVTELAECLNQLCSKGEAAYIGQLDLSKALPRLSRDQATEVFKAKGAPDWLAQFVRGACLEKSLAWRVNGRLSRFVKQTRGTPQGCAMSILLFQIAVAPVIAEVEKKIKADGRKAKLLVYADDIAVNEAKSSVTAINTSLPFEPFLNGVKIPVRLNTDVLGCSLIQRRAKLPVPQALAKTSELRSIMRRRKVLDRLSRLKQLHIKVEAKDALWRQVILPVITYDPWVLLPTKQTGKAWRSVVTNSIFGCVAGPKDSCVAACLLSSPHQIDMTDILLHECLRVAYPFVCEQRWTMP
eukprot:3686186-Amphidinium_carterae.5